jgi:hypothetical protein
MTTEDKKKCAHPPCTCDVSSDSAYCSAQCAAMEESPEIDCRCTHIACKGKAHPLALGVRDSQQISLSPISSLRDNAGNVPEVIFLARQRRYNTRSG